MVVSIKLILCLILQTSIIKCINLNYFLFIVAKINLAIWTYQRCKIVYLKVITYDTKKIKLIVHLNQFVLNMYKL